MIGKWISFSSLSFSSVREKVKHRALLCFFFWSSIHLCVTRKEQIWCCKKGQKRKTNKKTTHTTRKPKRNMGRSRSRSICLGPGVELHLITAQPALVSCHFAFCAGNLQKTNKETKLPCCQVQWCKSPGVFKCKDGWNMTWIQYKGEEITFFLSAT